MRCHGLRHRLEMALHTAVQGVVFQGLPMRPVRRLLYLAIGLHHKTTMPPAPVASAIFQIAIGRQVVPQRAKGLQMHRFGLRQGEHIWRRQNRVAACAQAAV